MASVSNKVKERLVLGIKKFQPVLLSAKSRDVNESDTVMIVSDILSEVFGYDKYSEITSEFAIRSTFVDLAIKVNGRIEILFEVKAIGLELKENFIKQAVDYAANQGVDWVVLTNGVIWQVYNVFFNKPIEQELVLEMSFLDLNPKNDLDCDHLSLLTKEGIEKSLLGDYQAQRQALSRYYIGQMILTDPILDVVRKELKKVSPDVKIDNEQIKEVMVKEIIKREVLEGEKAENAKKKIIRSVSKQHKKNQKEDSDIEEKSEESTVQADVVEPVTEAPQKTE